MNMFSKWSDSTSGKEQTQEDNNNAKPSNLAVWSSGSSWINEDLTQSNVNTGWNTSGNNSQEKEALAATQNNQELSEIIQSATKTHNGVTWTYKKDSNTNEISITGTAANLYKSKGGNSTFYQTAFKTTEGDAATIDPAASVSIKLIIVPGTAQAQPTGRSTN